MRYLGNAVVLLDDFPPLRHERDRPVLLERAHRLLDPRHQRARPPNQAGRVRSHPAWDVMSRSILDVARDGRLVPHEGRRVLMRVVELLHILEQPHIVLEDRVVLRT